MQEMRDVIDAAIANKESEAFSRKIATERQMSEYKRTLQSL